MVCGGWMEPIFCGFTGGASVFRPAAPGVAVVGVRHVQRIAEEVSIGRATTTTTGGHCGNVGDAQHPTTGRAHLVVMHGRSGGGCCCSCGRGQRRGHGGATTTGGRLLRRLDEALEAEPLRNSLGTYWVNRERANCHDADDSDSSDLD
ncbi:hypothetical protein TYRP_005570 [Tyrophagus putrescentiae]|nr:hypothetical protein TYRP_005570 [Tyrophagus putrescentiae]